VNANLHADGHRLPLGQPERARHEIAHREAHEVEGEGRQADETERRQHLAPVLGEGGADHDEQEDEGEGADWLAQALGERGLLRADHHADGHGHEDDRERLDHLVDRDGDRLAGAQEGLEAEPHEEREAHQGEDAVRGGQRDVEGHVAVRKVAEYVG